MSKKTGIVTNPLFTKTEDKKPKDSVSKSVNQQVSKSISQQSNIASNLQRATFYFSPNQLKELERIRFELLQNHNIKIDKSAIMRAALDLIIENTDKLINQYTNKSVNQ